MQQQPPSDCHTLFVKNLSYQASDDDISQAVKKMGVTRQSQGFYYIDFDTADDAKKVMEAGHRFTVNGRLVRLGRLGRGSNEGSYRADSGRLWSKEVQERSETR